jgi:SAM-dependent methyltransferase
MARRLPAVRQDLAIATVAVVGVAATLLSAALVEALTDRDWSIGHLEWLDDAVLALLVTIGALWLLTTLAPRPKRSLRVEHGIAAPENAMPRRQPAPTTRRPIRPGRFLRAAYRRVPRAPFRFLMPTRLWRGTFRFWLSVLAADPDTRRGIRRLLVAYDDAYRAVDQAAIRYDDGVHVKHRLTHYHDFFVERINDGERVLDVGTGKGEVAFDLVTLSGAVVVGVDHDPHHLAFARNRFRHRNLDFHEGDVLTSLPTGHFDVIVLSNVFEHLDNRVDFLRTLVGSATPTRLLFRVPVYEREWTVPLRDEVGLSGFWDRDHKIEYTPETFTQELHDAGLSVSELLIRWGEIWAIARVHNERPERASRLSAANR